MSGGHYDYLCFKIGDAGEEVTQPKDHQAIRQVISKLLKGLADIMYEVEWEDSGDGGDWKKVDNIIREVFMLTKLNLENIKKCQKYEMITEIVTQLPK